MFCKNCGTQMNDDAAFCPNCGSAANAQPVQNQQQQQPQAAPAQQNTQPTQSGETNTIAIVGFVLSFIIALAGLICSIIGYKNAAKFNGQYKGLALAGIIISAVWMAIALIVVIVVVSNLNTIVDGLNDYYYYY